MRDPDTMTMMRFMLAERIGCEVGTSDFSTWMMVTFSVGLEGNGGDVFLGGMTTTVVLALATNRFLITASHSTGLLSCSICTFAITKTFPLLPKTIPGVSGVRRVPSINQLYSWTRVMALTSQWNVALVPNGTELVRGRTWTSGGMLIGVTSQRRGSRKALLVASQMKVTPLSPGVSILLKTLLCLVAWDTVQFFRYHVRFAAGSPPNDSQVRRATSPGQKAFLVFCGVSAVTEHLGYPSLGGIKTVKVASTEEAPPERLMNEQ